MYTPRHFAMTDAHVRSLLGSAETAHLVTAHETGPVATLLPVVWRPDPAGAGWGSLALHVTRVNPVWKEPHLGDALAILSGPAGYIDPDWFPGNAEAPGVPTWNYVTVHAYGPLVVHDDAAWTRAAAFDLSDRFGYDAERVDPGAIDRLLRATVGIELPITRVEAKAKLNQNRAPEDIAGAVAGLREAGSDALASEMETVSLPHAEARFQLLADVKDGRRLGEAAPR